MGTLTNRGPAASRYRNTLPTLAAIKSEKESVATTLELQKTAMPVQESDSLLAPAKRGRGSLAAKNLILNCWPLYKYLGSLGTCQTATDQGVGSKGIG